MNQQRDAAEERPSEGKAGSASRRKLGKGQRSPRSLSGVGFEFASTLGGACLLGYWIGKHYGKADIGIVIGACVGLVVGLLNSVQTALKVSKQAERRAKAERERRES